MPRNLLPLLPIVLFLIILASPNSIFALVRTYSTADSGVKVGMVVALKSDSGKNLLLVRADESNANQTVGVVTGLQVSKTDRLGAAELSVADSGVVEAYVSNVNGPPRAGDLLAPSPLGGILMLAGPGSHGVVGTMSGSINWSSEQTIKLSGGQIVKVAAVSVSLGSATANIPDRSGGLRSFVSRLVGRQVSDWQTTFALIIAAVALMVAVIIIYAAVANYLRAISRNPLASKVLWRGLIRFGVLAIAILVAGLIGCWVVIW